MIYIVSRPNTTYILKILNLNNEKLELNYLLKYNLPDGLWSFSIASLILIIWNWKINLEVLIWFTTLIFCSIILEFMFGTYDVLDLSFLLIGILTPFIYTLKINFKNKFYEHKKITND